MVRRSAILASCVALLVVPASAEAMIQIDRGIAGVRIGNTRAQVRAALGRPAQVKAGTNDFGAFTEYRYHGGIRVIFQGGAKVTSVDTTGLGDRTSRGVGVGSRERTVRRKVPGVKCETISGARSCHTGAFRPGRRITDFQIRNRRVTRVTVGVVID